MGDMKLDGGGGVDLAGSEGVGEKLDGGVFSVSTKSILKSRTLWLNVGMAVVAIAGVMLDGGLVPEKYLAHVTAAFAIANVILRLLTNQPVHFARPRSAKEQADALKNAIEAARKNAGIEQEPWPAEGGITENAKDAEGFYLSPPAGQSSQSLAEKEDSTIDIPAEDILPDFTETSQPQSSQSQASPPQAKPADSSSRKESDNG